MLVGTPRARKRMDAYSSEPQTTTRVPPQAGGTESGRHTSPQPCAQGAGGDGRTCDKHGWRCAGAPTIACLKNITKRACH